MFSSDRVALARIYIYIYTIAYEGEVDSDSVLSVVGI